MKSRLSYGKLTEINETLNALLKLKFIILRFDSWISS